MPLDHSGAKDGRQELMIAMRALFEAYDKDRSGSVNLDDFVETQAEVLSENEGGLHLPLQDLVAQYLEVRRPGQVGLDGAGLDFEERQNQGLRNVAAPVAAAVVGQWH